MCARDCHRLGAIKKDKHYDNAIHSAIESVLSIYLAKKRDKTLRRNFGLLEREKNLFLE